MLTATSTPGGSFHLNAQAIYAALVAALVGGVASAALINQLSTRRRAPAGYGSMTSRSSRSDKTPPPPARGTAPN